MLICVLVTGNMASMSLHWVRDSSLPQEPRFERVPNAVSGLGNVGFTFAVVGGAKTTVSGAEQCNMCAYERTGCSASFLVVDCTGGGRGAGRSQRGGL